MISKLIDYLIDRHFFFDNELIIVVLYQARMPNICWLQLLKCEDLLLVLVFLCF